LICLPTGTGKTSIAAHILLKNVPPEEEGHFIFQDQVSGISSITDLSFLRECGILIREVSRACSEDKWVH
jgi:hypothetical protein